MNASSQRLLDQISKELETHPCSSPVGHRMMVTGHRPDKLFGYDINDPKYNRIKQWLGMYIDAAKKKYPEVSFISGMALGTDMIFAHEVNRRRLPLYAYIPTKKQYAVWHEESKQEWYDALVAAKSIHITNTEENLTYSQNVEVMQERNEDMVDDADTVLAIWDGYQKGGTWNCIEYALSERKHLICYNPFKNIQADSWKPWDEEGGINWFIKQSSK